MASLPASDPRCGPLCSCGGPKYHYSVQCRGCSRSSRYNRIDPRFAPVEEPDAAIIAWTAGFFEGEGSVGFYSSGTFAVRMGQKQRWPLEKIRHYFGGAIYGQKDRMSSLELNGILAERFIEKIEPWLSPRRRAQIETARLRKRIHQGEEVMLRG
jgi:hypothetical protein